MIAPYDPDSDHKLLPIDEWIQAYLGKYDNSERNRLTQDRIHNKQARRFASSVVATRLQEMLFT